MAEKIGKGILITFDGPEGSGKSTQSELMCEELSMAGYDVVRTGEPGGTLLGGKIREILLEKDDIPMGEIAELFLFEADRAQHMEEVILPAIEKKKIVICDRFNTATFAYQGAGLGMDMGMIRKIDIVSTGGIVPDLTILLDIDTGSGMARASARSGADRMEKRKAEFHHRVRKGYLELAAEDPARIKVIKADGDIEHTRLLVKKEIYDLLERYKRSG